MTFYVYFRNKYELLRYIWEDIFALADAHAQGSIDKSKNICDQIVIYNCAWIEYWIYNPDNFRIAFLNQDQLTSGDDIYFARHTSAQHFPSLVDWVKRGIAEGTFAEMDPIAAAQALLTCSIGLAYSLIMVPEAGWRNGLAETTLKLVVQGLRTTPRQA